MKKFVITSPKFNGEINILYGLPEGELPGKLQFIDFMKADLNEEQIIYFKKYVPAFYTDKLGEAFGEKSQLTLMESGYKVTFDMMWERYANKKNRLRAEKLWGKLSEADQVNAYFKYYLYDRYCKLNARWYNKALLETYLAQRYWESEWK